MSRNFSNYVKSFNTLSCGNSRVGIGNFVIDKVTLATWRITHISSNSPYTLLMYSETLGEKIVDSKELYKYYIPYLEYLDTQVRKTKSLSLEIYATENAIKGLINEVQRLSDRLYNLTLDIEKVKESMKYAN